MTNGLHFKGVEGDALQAPKKIRGISHTNFLVEALKAAQVKHLFKAVELISKSPTVVQREVCKKGFFFRGFVNIF